MTFRALVSHFSTVETRVAIDDVIGWIVANSDHKIINLHPVGRGSKAFRGAFRRRSVSKSLRAYDSEDCEIVTDVLYGTDLNPEWQRLVICKEVLHVFDGPGECVDNPEKVEALITGVIAPELKEALSLPALNDHIGPYRAMAVLVPRASRIKLAKAVADGTRTVAEVATFLLLPDYMVDIWLREGEKIEAMLKLQPESRAA